MPVPTHSGRTAPRILFGYCAAWMCIAIAVVGALPIAAWWFDVGDRSPGWNVEATNRQWHPHLAVATWMVVAHALSFAVGPFLATRICVSIPWSSRPRSDSQSWYVTRRPYWSLLFVALMGAIVAFLPPPPMSYPEHGVDWCATPLLCRDSSWGYLLAFYPTVAIVGLWLVACFAGSAGLGTLYVGNAHPNQFVMHPFWGKPHEVTLRARSRALLVDEPVRLLRSVPRRWWILGDAVAVVDLGRALSSSAVRDAG